MPEPSHRPTVVTFRCEVCREPLAFYELIHHLRRFHPDSFDPDVDTPDRIEEVAA